MVGNSASTGVTEMVITTFERIEQSRKSRGLRDLTTTEISEILTTGYYDEEKYISALVRKKQQEPGS